MGYTHYWKRPVVLSWQAFEAFRADAEKVLAALPERTGTAGGYFRDEPLCLERNDSRDAVRFNGRGMSPPRGDEDDRLGCEEFQIGVTAPRGRAFCKTGRLPYDLAVTACLIVAHRHFPAWEITSDGDAAEWADALALCRRVLGSAELPPLIRPAKAAAGRS